MALRCFLKNWFSEINCFSVVMEKAKGLCKPHFPFKLISGSNGVHSGFQAVTRYLVLIGVHFIKEMILLQLYKNSNKSLTMKHESKLQRGSN